MTHPMATTTATDKTTTSPRHLLPRLLPRPLSAPNEMTAALLSPLISTHLPPDPPVHSPTRSEDGLTVEEQSYGNDDALEPRVGMEFLSQEEAKSLYLRYAKYVGFGVCTRHSRRSKSSNEFIAVKFACTRFGGKRDTDASNPRPCFKIDCKATLHVKKKDGKWVVHDFVKEHNHDLFPEHAHYFPCHRSISSMDKSSSNGLHVGGVNTSKICEALAKQNGVYADIGSTEKDLGNHVDKRGCLGLEPGDANAMLELFMHMQEENLNFFYAMDLDENLRLRNVFWVDAKGREDYKIFGDVVSFDTTYISNKYKMPFAPFIGVNNHFQSTLLGCALLSDDTTSTFVWLMQTWLRAMGGKPPSALLTDQDKAMKSAIAEVFPDSKHHFCLWHILRKLPQKLGDMIKENEDFMQIFNKCIYSTWTSAEFEKEWIDMIERFELQNDEWLDSLFEDRSYWVPTYMRDTFFAGMSTTQRSESMNSFFDKYVHKKTTLKEFVEQYNAALQDRQEQEAQADFRTWHAKPITKSPSPFERRMSEIYTHEVFKKFQVEVLGVGGCYLKERGEGNIIKLFKVHDFQMRYDFMVEWNESKREIYCGCRLFQYCGFLCRHVMMVFQSLGIFDIPSLYILERWTKDVKAMHSTSVTNQIKKGVEYKKHCFDKLFQEAIKLSKEGSLSTESFGIAMLGLKETFKKCALENKSLKNSEEVGMHGNPSSISIIDPPVAKTKGAPKRRTKHPLDKNNKRKCNKSGEVHAEMADNDNVET